MNTAVQIILGHLQRVELERQRRAASAALAERVLALKAYQQRRFARTYADLLSSPRYAAAAHFFLDELYGPKDYSQRDTQFARVVPVLVSLFPGHVVDTVMFLGELHALSEELDSIAASHLVSVQVDASAYVRAWQATGRADDRERQICLTLSVGESLDGFTRNPVLRHSLRMMRVPARAAGLGELQRFLESGFDTFKAMNGAEEFLATIGARERTLAKALFDADAQSSSREGDSVFGQLP